MPGAGLFKMICRKCGGSDGGLSVNCWSNQFSGIIYERIHTRKDEIFVDFAHSLV